MTELDHATRDCGFGTTKSFDNARLRARTLGREAQHKTRWHTATLE